MHRMQCVLSLLALYVGVVQSFSWDIVVSRDNRLEFYDKGTFTYSAKPTRKEIHWITYDPLHNRVLFENTYEKAVLSYDIATGKTQTLINFKLFPWRLVYDPARELLFAIVYVKGKRCIKSILVKPGSNAETEGNHVINLQKPAFNLAVDSCRGYIYWTAGSYSCTIEKVHINASEVEVINEGCKDSIKTALTIDPQTQKMYWAENKNFITRIFNADLDGNNKITLFREYMQTPYQISVSKDFIYWVVPNEPFFFQLPKNTSLDIDADVKPKRFAFNNVPTDSRFPAIASNYAIQEQTEGNLDCRAMISLLPSLPTKAESCVSGTTCDVSVCHNYCFQGNCSVSADGQPKCRCNVGYAGVRCEVNACQTYCIHGGVCSLSEQNNPVCQCTAGYQGERCDVPAFRIKCSQAVPLLKDILNTDLTSVTEGKGVKSTDASTVV